MTSTMLCEGKNVRERERERGIERERVRETKKER